LVLVPEISLTPQLVARFQERFLPLWPVLHSSLSDTERLAAWRSARSGAAPIVGRHSFRSLRTAEILGIIVVDEETRCFVQAAEGFRYSARDLAIVRAQRSPSPSSWIGHAVAGGVWPR